MPTASNAIPVKAGDILFFAPTNWKPKAARPASALHSAKPETLSFAQVAARVQDYPYTSPHPWGHVAIAVSERAIVDYDPPRTPSGGDPASDGGPTWGLKLEKRELRQEDDVAVTIVRLQDHLGPIAHAAETMVRGHYTYNNPGLLAFAAATQARLYVAGKAREDLMNYAAGLDSVAALDPRADTCVTGVARALGHAGIRLDVHEPPVAPQADLAGLELMLGAAVEALEATAAKLAAESAAGAVPVHAAGPVRAATGHHRFGRSDVVKAGYGFQTVAPVPSAPVHAAPGTLIGDTTNYVAVLEDASTWVASKHVSLEALCQLGADKREGGDWPQATRFVVSPAMLYDALQAYGPQVAAAALR